MARSGIQNNPQIAPAKRQASRGIAPLELLCVIQGPLR